MPGRDDDNRALPALRFDGRFDTGAEGLAREGELSVTRSRPWLGTRSDVAYKTSEQVHLRAGGILSELPDRVAAQPLRTRVHVDAVLPREVNASWSELRGKIAKLEARACGAAERATCTNRIDARVERGTVRADDYDVLLPPALPDVPLEVPAGGGGGRLVHPPFTSRDGRDAVRAVVLAPERWGVHAVLTNLVRIDYSAEYPAQSFCLASRPQTGGFVANIYDHTADKPLWVDATLNRLPDDVGARIVHTSKADDATPWVWVNTESCDAQSPGLLPDAMVRNPPIELDLLVRSGDPDELRDLTNAALARNVALLAPRAPRPAVGFDVWGEFHEEDLAVNARARIQVPLHTQVFRPTEQRCDVSSPLAVRQGCQGRRFYEMDESRKYRLRYESTARDLGDLKAWLHAYAGASQTNVTVEASVEHVPGSLQGYAELRTNRRLPWTKAIVSFDAGAPLGNVAATVWDHTKEVYAGPDEALYRIPQNLVPNYSLTLANVPRKLRVEGYLQSYPGPGEGSGSAEKCGEWTPVGPKDVPFVHASFNLGNRVTDIRLNARSGLRWTSHDYDTTTVTLDADAPLSGTVSTKILNLFNPIDREAESAFLPWWLLGIPLGDSEFDGCLDFDLPVEVTLSGISRLRMGIAGAKVVMDVPAADRARGGNVSGRIREFYFEPNFQGGRVIGLDGAWFRHHKVSFDPVGPGDWDDNAVGRRLVYILDPEEECHDHVCYHNRPHDTFSFADYTIDEREAGWASARFVLDPLFDDNTRRDMYCRDNDDGCYVPFPERPGGELYDRLVDEDLFRTPDPETFLPAALSELMGGWGETPGAFETEVVNPACEQRWQAEPTANPWPRLSDGTLFSLVVTDDCWRDFQTGVVTHSTSMGVVARDQNIFIRWVRWVAADGRGPLPQAPLAWQQVDLAGSGAERRFRVSFDPHVDGSVDVSVQERGRENAAGRGWTAWADTANRWAGRLGPDGQGAFSPHVGVGQFRDKDARLDQVTSWGAQNVPAGVTRVYHYGDGVKETFQVGQADMVADHVYRRPAWHFLQVVDYDAEGEIVAADWGIVKVAE